MAKRRAHVKAHIEPWDQTPFHPHRATQSEIQTQRPDRVPIDDPGLGNITFASYNFIGYHLGNVADGGAVTPYSFTCLLGDGAPEVTDGYGGWEAVPRARNVALVQWNGRNPLTMKIPIMFDDFAGGNGTKIEADIRQLEKMAGLEVGMKQPPLVLFNSMGVVPHDIYDAGRNDFVISSIEWGDSDRNEHGNRVRQAASVIVMEYSFDDVIGGAALMPSQKSKKAAKNLTKRRHYITRPGDTLILIAHKELKNSHLWRELVKVNKSKSGKPYFKDPYKVIPSNTTIVLPLNARKV